MKALTFGATTRLGTDRPDCPLRSGSNDPFEFPLGSLEIETKSPCDPFAVRRIRAQAVGDVPFLDVPARITHCPGCILEQCLLLRPRHQAEQVAWLLPVVVVGIMVIVRRLRPQVAWLLPVVVVGIMVIVRR